MIFRFSNIQTHDSKIPISEKFNNDRSRWIDLKQVQKWNSFKFYFCYGFLNLFLFFVVILSFYDYFEKSFVMNGEVLSEAINLLLL